MEASPQQQLQPDDGTVRVLDDRLVIEALEVVDERAARIVRDRLEAGEPPAATVQRAVEIGARVLDREGTAGEVDYVRAEFERVQADVRERMIERDNALTEKIRGALETVPQNVRENVERVLSESRESQLTAILKELGTRQETAARELREASAREQAAMREKIEALTEQVARDAERREGDERVAEAEEAGTRKGRTFEDRVHDALEQIAGARGDIAHHVGDQAGAGGSKKGDTVVEVGAGQGSCEARVAFEAKDSQLSKPKAWDELNGALAARNADFAVLAVAGDENLPPGPEALTEYEGNKLIVAVDPEQPETDPTLAIAYRYARLRALLARENALTVDAAGVRGAAAEAKAVLDGIKAIKSSLTKATNNVQQAKGAIEAIAASLLEKLDRIESLVEGVDEA
jgi:hypothetical protein